MNGRALALLAALTAITPSGVATQDTMSGTEARIAEAVDARSDEAIALLERIVGINSGTMNFEGVRRVGAVLRAELDALGFETEWVDGAPFGRAGHLVARRDGVGPRLLLIGHLDTVFEADSPFQRFERSGERATGPGVVDMKGGDVVIVHALRALADADVLEGMSLRIVMTGDEEASGDPLRLSKAALVEAAEWADIAVAFENGDSDPRTAVIARRGSTGWKLEVSGTPAHSSQLFQPEVGSGAIYEAARILDGFRERLAGEPLLTFNPGVMVAGTEVKYDDIQSRGTAFGKSNVVAGRAIITGDLRTISLEQLELARARMAYVARQSLPGTGARLTFEDGYPPMAPTEGNTRLLSLLDQVSRALGSGGVAPVDPRNAGAADVSFTAGLVEMAIDGLGPGGGSDHTADEWIDLPTLALQTKRAAVLLQRLSSRGVS
jgi:glutamate carboxypeptidase